MIGWISTLIKGSRPLITAPSGSPSLSGLTEKTIQSHTIGTDAPWYGRPVVKTISGGIMVLCYAQSDSHPSNLWSQLHYRFSNDYGTTWTDEDTYIDGSAVSGVPMYPPGAVPGTNDDGPGDGWLIVCPNGDLLCQMWKVDYGQTKNGNYQSRSTDGGKTWSTPELVTWQDIPAVENLFIYATDDDFVLDNTIYMGVRWYAEINQNDGIKNGLVKSTDNGYTWSYIADITDFTTNPTNEVGIEYVGNNTIIAIVRGWDTVANGGPNKRTYLAKSTDMGLTWALSTPTTLQVVGRPRIRSRSHLMQSREWWRDPVLICNCFENMNVPASASRRNCIVVSNDFGETWSEPLYVDTTGYDGGYGDISYNPLTDEYISFNYRGEADFDEGDVKQYNFKIVWL